MEKLITFKMTARKKIKPLSQEESNWFFQWWPDIRKTLVGAIFTMIGIGITTIVTLVVTTNKMKDDFLNMENTVSSMQGTV